MSDLDSILSSLPKTPRKTSTKLPIKLPKGMLHNCDHDHPVSDWQALAFCNMPPSFYTRASALPPNECCFVAFKSEIDLLANRLQSAANRTK